jgi:hypothetical protein
MIDTCRLLLRDAYQRNIGQLMFFDDENEGEEIDKIRVSS